MRFKDLRAKRREERKEGKNLEQMGFKYFHVSTEADLTEIKPRLARYHGPREQALFITTEDHLKFWVNLLSDQRNSPTMHIYGVHVPEDAVVETGIEGQNFGDYKIVTDQPIKVEYIKSMPGIASLFRKPRY